VRVTGRNLAAAQYRNIIDRSNSVLLESFMATYLPREELSYIRSRFRLIYSDPDHEVYARQ